MKPRLLTVVLTATTLAAGAGAQSLISNGDFAKVDANGNPTGWTVQKFDIAPKVVKFDTAGTGADNVPWGPILLPRGTSCSLRLG